MADFEAALTGQERAVFDEQLREKIRQAMTIQKATPVEIVFLLTRMLPELCDRRHAHGQVEAAFDLYHQRHPELMIDETGPAPRVEP